MRGDPADAFYSFSHEPEKIRFWQWNRMGELHYSGCGDRFTEEIRALAALHQ